MENMAERGGLFRYYFSNYFLFLESDYLIYFGKNYMFNIFFILS